MFISACSLHLFVEVCLFRVVLFYCLWSRRRRLTREVSSRSCILKLNLAETAIETSNEFHLRFRISRFYCVEDIDNTLYLLQHIFVTLLAYKLVSLWLFAVRQVGLPILIKELQSIDIPDQHGSGSGVSYDLTKWVWYINCTKRWDLEQANQPRNLVCNTILQHQGFWFRDSYIISYD